jgi:hypothetical protein
MSELNVRPDRNTFALRATLRVGVLGALLGFGALASCGSEAGDAASGAGGDDTGGGGQAGGAGGGAGRGAGGDTGSGGSGVGTECREEEIECDGECVDASADPDHCGQCVRVCAADQVCSDGSCDVDCEPGRVVCERGCIDPNESEAFCGAAGDCTGDAAGEACSPNERCQEGTCSSADARLDALDVFPGELAPAFASERLSYSVEVPWYALRLSLTPAGGAGVDSIEIGGVAVEFGTDYLVPQTVLDVAASSDARVEIDVVGESGASNRYEVAHDRDVARLTQLKPSDTPEGEGSGSRLAFSGDTLVIAGQSGVELRQLSSGSWLRRGMFALATAPRSVAVDGDVAVAAIGGEVHTFVRDGTLWTTEAPLTTPASEPELFGESVAIAGDTLAVGAPREDGGAAGSVHIYLRASDAWEHQVAIFAPDHADSPNSFGSRIAMDGDTLVVAALPGNDAVFAFTGSGADWSEQATLELPTSSGDAAFFGRALAIDGDDVAVGAPYLDAEGNGGLRGGEVHVFHRAGTTFAHQGTLLPSNRADGDGFGSAVSIDAGLVAAGAEAAAGGGAAYVFGRRGSVWFELGNVKPATVGAGDLFGRDIGFQGGILAVGAPGDDADVSTPDGAPDSGAAWIFECTACPDE